MTDPKSPIMIAVADERIDTGMLVALVRDASGMLHARRALPTDVYEVGMAKPGSLESISIGLERNYVLTDGGYRLASISTGGSFTTSDATLIAMCTKAHRERSRLTSATLANALIAAGAPSMDGAGNYIIPDGGLWVVTRVSEEPDDTWTFKVEKIPEASSPA